MMQTLILLAADPEQQGPGIFQFLPLIAIALVFYLLLIRPMKEQQERQTLASNLKKNDEVLTNAGIYGTVVDVGDASDDRITVKIADNVRVKMTKASIFRNLTNEEAARLAKETKEVKA